MLDLHFDLYFVESGGCKIPLRSRAQQKLCQEVVKNHTDLIVFKNIWEFPNDLKYCLNNLIDDYYYLADCVVPALNSSDEELARLVGRLTASSGIFMQQYCSTAISMICVAYNLGFKKIVLHGVDLGGPHFGCCPKLQLILSIHRPVMN